MPGFTLHEKIGILYPKINVPFQYISSTIEQRIIEEANALSVQALDHKPAKAEELSSILKMSNNKFAAA